MCSFVIKILSFAPHSVFIYSAIFAIKGNYFTRSNNPLLEAFATLRVATISLVMSVRTDKLGYYWTNFHEILYLIAGKFALEFQVWLKSYKNNGYTT